ncbi:MAG: hypothetical protein ACJ70P_04190 [Nitrososphaera sp.]|jgi:hypothetical protein
MITRYMLSYVSEDRNYTDNNNSGIDSTSGRAGDVTGGEPPTNQATDRDKAAKMANLLEGLQFPATKEDIKNHINRKSPAMGNRINDIFEAIWNNLPDNNNVSYNSAYEVEKAAGLVEKA